MSTHPNLAAILLLAVAASNCAATPPPTPSAAEPAPALSAMIPAQRSGGKIGVPVDVRYQFSGVMVAGRPTNLQLAVIPRVQGENLRIELAATPGVAVLAPSAPLKVGKAAAAGVYRHAFALTHAANAPAKLPLIVSMEIDGARFFSVFAIPLSADAPID
ncbi:MAG: hypothetical protein AB7P31_00485 [Steroidobacteraceae bacterium]